MTARARHPPGLGLLVALTLAACGRPPTSDDAGGLKDASVADDAASAIDQASAPVSEVVDSSSMCLGVRCCPSGFGMRGTTLDGSAFLCRSVQQQHEDCFVDHPTRRSAMHACPRGTYLRGWGSAQGVLACCFDRERGYSELTTETIDAASTQAGMRACPLPSTGESALMTGIDPATNLLLCARAPQVPTPIAAPVMIELDPEQPRSFSALHATSAHSTWKAAVRNWLARLLDVPPDRAYLTAPSVTETAPETIVEGGVRRRTISYPSPVDGTPIPAYVFFPAGFSATQTYRGALLVHGHFSEAKEGLGASWVSPLHAIALYLAQQGFVTLAPDTRTWGEYAVPGELVTGWVGHELELQRLVLESGHYGAMPSQTLADNLVSVSVLKQQATLSSIVVEGLSLGSTMAMWLAAVDDRVGDVVLAGNYISLACENNAVQNHPCQAMPGLSRDLADPTTSLLLDAGDVAGLIAPNRLYAMWGLAGDGNFTQKPLLGAVPCAQIAADDATAVYAALGIPDHFRISPIAGMHHEIDTTSSYEFFTQLPASDQVDYATTCAPGMRCCAAGKAMHGLDLDRDDLLCRDAVPAAFEACTTDPGTVRQGVRACPAGAYLRGLDQTNPALQCCTDSRIPPLLVLGDEIVDGTTRSQGMSACPPTKVLATGVEWVARSLLCSGL